MHIGIIRENRNHIIVVLCRMHPDPRHHIQSRSSVLVERLMIMPDKRHIQRLILSCHKPRRQPHHNCHKQHKYRSSHNPSFHGLALPPYIFTLQAHLSVVSLGYPLAACLAHPSATRLRHSPAASLGYLRATLPLSRIETSFNVLTFELSNVFAADRTPIARSQCKKVQINTVDYNVVVST
jgi:hypothetical protein